MSWKLDSFYRGDSVEFNVQFNYDDGTKVPLTGGQLYFTMKPKFNGDVPDAEASLQVVLTSFTDGDNGNTDLTLPPIATVGLAPGEYRWDIQFVDGLGATVFTIPPAEEGPGEVRVIADVTRRVV